MNLTKHGLLAAVAATALVAGAGAFAQQSPSAPSGTELQSGAKADAKAEKKTTTQAPMKDSGATTQGGAKVEGKTEAQAPKTDAKQEPRGQVQQQQQDMKPGQAQQKPGAKEGAKEPGQAQQPGAKQPGQAESGAKAGAKGDAKSVELNSEQRTKISTTIKQQTNLKRVSRSEVNFTINVGAVVPRTFGLVVLPAPIIAVVPQWRGYLYIIVDDQLLIIHPTTYEIVAVLPA